MMDPAIEIGAVWRREQEFHDTLAGQIDVDALDEETCTTGLDAELVRLAGPVRGRTVLDVGCGQGDLTLRLIRDGAFVTALDLSPGMTAIAARRAARLGADAESRLTAVTAPLEHSMLPADSFDLIVGKFVLHHVDVRTGAKELRRLLRPGGTAIFIENTANNRLLSFARNHLAGRYGIPRYGTQDEHPLTAADVDVFRREFPTVLEHFPVFEFVGLFDRQVLRYRYPKATMWCGVVDNTLYRLTPGIRRYSYRVILEMRTSDGRES